MTIRMLPEGLINQIAAGEVIERPSSIIKELIENSIDSGANKIEVSIRGGGLESISVSDNGIGIASEELSIAVLRHATSKLDENNLNNITNFGFRGEAIPAIASVSNIVITSKSLKDSHGSSISILGGKIEYQKPASRDIGTTVVVSELFSAIPARLKFLKSKNTEISHCKNIFEKMALSHPSIAFRLKIDGINTINLRISEKEENKLEFRVRNVLGKQLFDNFLFINAKKDDCKLIGFVGIPTINKSTAAYQSFYVNNRLIKDRGILAAVRVAYGDTIPKGRKPVVVLFLSLSPSSIDVNVHPSKVEVRFENIQKIRSLIIGSIKTAISNSAYLFNSELSYETLSKFYSENNYNGNYRSSHNLDNSLSKKKETIGSSFISNNNNGIEYLDAPPKAPLENSENNELLEYPMGAAKAQFHSTYILSESSEGIVIVDQHAAHERLVMEEMKLNILNGKVPAQLLLIPVIISLNSLDSTALLENIKPLDLLGFKIEPFGENTVLIREVPTILGNASIENIIKDVAEELSVLGTHATIDEKIENVIAKSACYGSVRSGRKLTGDEMNAILRKMEITPNSSQCNHGRPTSIKLSLKDIEKLFGRR